MIKRIALSFALVAGLTFGQAQPKPKSQKESEAILAIFNAQDSDARIKAAPMICSPTSPTPSLRQLPCKLRPRPRNRIRLREDGRLRRAYP